MSKKQLLNEQTVKKFMRLANINKGVAETFAKDKFSKRRALRENVGLGDDELEAALDEFDRASGGGAGKRDEMMYEQDEELPDEDLDMDMGGEMPEEEPVEDLGGEEGEEGEVSISPEEADVLVKLADKLKPLVSGGGAPTGGEMPDLEAPEEEMPEMPEDEFGAEGGEEMPEVPEDEEEKVVSENMINRIAARVAARILKEQKAARAKLAAKKVQQNKQTKKPEVKKPAVTAKKPVDTKKPVPTKKK